MNFQIHSFIRGMFILLLSLSDPKWWKRKQRVSKVNIPTSWIRGRQHLNCKTNINLGESDKFKYLLSWWENATIGKSLYIIHKQYVFIMSKPRRCSEPHATEKAIWSKLCPERDGTVSRIRRRAWYQDHWKKWEICKVYQIYTVLSSSHPQASQRLQWKEIPS